MTSFHDFAKRVLTAILLLAVVVPILYVGGRPVFGLMAALWVGLAVELLWGSRGAPAGPRWEVRLLGAGIPLLSGIPLLGLMAFNEFLISAELRQIGRAHV